MFGKSVTLLTLIACTHALHLTHDYAAALESYLVSQSTPLKQLYKCKDRCFALLSQMNIQGKYTRIVWSKLHSDNRYLEGHCLFSQQNITSSQKQWRSIEQYSDQEKIQQFRKQCQNKTTQLNEELREKLGLTNIHSSFQFYSDGNFINLHKGETDINQLFAQVFPKIVS